MSGRWLSLDLLAGRVDEAHSVPRSAAQGRRARRAARRSPHRRRGARHIGITHYLTSERYHDEHTEGISARAGRSNGRQD
jgi:dTDP-4-dehydrorhamnose reductase